MEKSGIKKCFFLIVFILGVFVLGPVVEAKGLSVSPPKKPVKLIFIHHSCGENWLSDNNGGLGRALGKNNYFVSDTNYGWGPSNIGDRTDIVNWTEWFASSKTPRYMKALLNENRRHSSFTRKMSDPGGKNRIVMFKSCFPNSELRGKPGDPPKMGSGLTVANAKATYIKLLSFFAKHPETLFIAVAAPPVQNKRFSKNARAFNNWLVYEWLKNYKGYNVGVYDFFNTLTGPDNHHRIHKKNVEHIYNINKNTLYYAPVGDDHPLTRGNKKAVKEFIPLLNMFYNNWKEKLRYKTPRKTVLGKSKTAKQSKTVAEKSSGKSKAVAQPEKNIHPVSKSISNVADFEDGCSKWAVFSDDTSGTKIKFKCVPKNKNKALRVEYKVSNEGWGTCGLVYHSPVNWKKKKGISFKIMAKEVGKKIDFIVYQGKASNDLHHFELAVKTNKKMVNNWQKIMIPWKKLKRPSWEGNQKDRIDLRYIQGVAVGFTGEDNTRKSTIWIDNIKLY
jgi:Carbohydrate binding domain (family 11)